MSAAMPSAAQQQYPATGTSRQSPPEQSPRPPWRRLLHPLTAICAVQAALSLTLVWSNTAFADEAQYLSTGQLEWAHWMHGTHVPSYLLHLSGSPVIYPPLGALANSIGGLAGARILSLVFMLGATILLYLTASRLFGRAAAFVAAALWALSEPAIRLAFATFDPLSVLLTALSAWLVVQAGHRHRRGVFVAAAAAVLALANATAYSGIVIDPVVIAFAFLVWLPQMRARQASFYTVCLAGVLAVFYGLLMTVSGGWTGLMASVLNRSGSDQQGVLIVLNDSWLYSGLIAVLAVIGAVTAFGAESRQRIALLALLGCTALVVPAAQFHAQTAWSLDKHLAYGIWFAAIAAGYGCSTLIQRLPGAGRKFAALCCLLALVYPAVNSWDSAWKVYHAWPDTHSFITAFSPAVARSNGLIDVSETGPQNIAQYYTPQGRDWTRWSAVLQLDPATVAKSQWSSYYRHQLNSGKYGIIVLFYTTTFSPRGLPTTIVLPQDASTAYQHLLSLVGHDSGEPGLPALTQVLATDPRYQLEAQGPYNSADNYSIFAIWQKVRT